jgi:arylsulfatase A-like enzyme
MTPTKHTSPQPNIVICMCDQLRAHAVGCYGDPVARTANIDLLASEGIRFNHAVSPNPVCMPARSSILAGQYTRTCAPELGNAVYPFKDGTWGMTEYPDETRTALPDPTLPEVLRDHGYATGLFGKWHVRPSPTLVGFDTAVFPRVHHRYTGQTFIENTGLGEVVDGYSVAYEANRLAEWIGQQGKTPFFAHYNISLPHMPLLDAPEKYLQMFQPGEVPIRENAFRDGRLVVDENWFKVYLWDFLYYQEKLPETARLPDDFDLRQLTAYYYGLTAWADDMVGQMMESLARAGNDKNTIVIFCSDHGDMLGSHHLFNKGVLFEESARIPFIIHAPGRWMPQFNSAQVASLIDVMPTILAACGIDIPAHVQGRDLSPVLNGYRDALDEPYAFIEAPADDTIGIRTPRYLFGMRTNKNTRALLDEGSVFWDLEMDPYELNNLANQAKENETAAKLEARLRTWHERTPWFAN